MILSRNIFPKEVKRAYVMAVPLIILVSILSKPFFLLGIPGYYSALGGAIGAWIFLKTVERYPLWKGEVLKMCWGVGLLTWLILRSLKWFSFDGNSPVDLSTWEVVLGGISLDNGIALYLMVSICFFRRCLLYKRVVGSHKRLWYGVGDLLIRGVSIYLLVGGFLWLEGDKERAYLLIGSGFWYGVIIFLCRLSDYWYDKVVGLEKEAHCLEEEGIDPLYSRLLAFFIMVLVLTNIVSIRYIWLGNWLVTAGLLIYPLTFLITDLVSEVYGRKEAGELVIAGLWASIWMGIWIAFAVILRGDSWVDSCYSAFFSFSPGMILGSMSAYLIGQWLDVWLFHALKKATEGRYLWLRNNVGTIVSQLVDTFVFGFIVWEIWPRLGTSLTVDGGVWSKLVMNECIGKVVFALCDTPFLYFWVFLIRRYSTKV